MQERILLIPIEMYSLSYCSHYIVPCLLWIIPKGLFSWSNDWWIIEIVMALRKDLLYVLIFRSNNCFRKSIIIQKVIEYRSLYYVINNFENPTSSSILYLTTNQSNFGLWLLLKFRNGCENSFCRLQYTFCENFFLFLNVTSDGLHFEQTVWIIKNNFFYCIIIFHVYSGVDQFISSHWILIPEDWLLFSEDFNCILMMRPECEEYILKNIWYLNRCFAMKLRQFELTEILINFRKKYIKIMFSLGTLHLDNFGMVKFSWTPKIFLIHFDYIIWVH